MQQHTSQPIPASNQGQPEDRSTNLSKHKYKNNAHKNNSHVFSNTDGISIIFWNVNGINNLFNIENEMETLILTGDIICLSETWHTNESLNLPKFLRGFGPIYQSLAEKDKTRGRGSGGLIILIRNNDKYISNLIEQSCLWLIIDLKIRGTNLKYIIFFTYLKPSLGTNCINRLCESLENILELYKYHQCFVIGDFNSHIGQLNQLTEDIVLAPNVFDTRISLHNATNTRGIKLVENMELMGLYTLNGRTQGDIPGKFTFLNENGSSTIDLAWANIEGGQNVSHFSITPTLSSSPHSVCKIYVGKIKEKQNTQEAQLTLDVAQYEVLFKFNAEKILEYQLKLDQLRNIYFNSNSIEDLSKNLELAIKEAASASGMLKIKNNAYNKKSQNIHKPWFNEECKIRKYNCKTSTKKLNKEFSEANLNNFLTNKKIYSKVKNLAKNTYFKQIKDNLTKVENNSEFWKTIKLLKSKGKQANEISVERWEKFYIDIHAQKRPSLITFYDCMHPYFDTPITNEELQRSISKCKLKKAPGRDGLCNEFYKYLTPKWLHYIQNTFNLILEQEQVPKAWPIIHTFLIHKKGDKSDPLNYRGIALINTICKIFTQIINHRMRNWCEMHDSLNENQTGFRKGRGTLDNIFAVSVISQLHLRLQKQRMYAIFVDFKRAFDTVKLNLLWQKLYSKGISAKLIRILQNIYNNASMQVKVMNKLSSLIPISLGLLQGEILSPLLFSLFIDDIWDYFHNSEIRGLNIDGYNEIAVLGYADDLVILGYSPGDVQKKLDLLKNYCDINELEVNTTKTKILVFHKGRAKRIRHPFLYNGSPIEIVNKFNYLGTILSSSGKFNLAATENYKKATMASQQVKHILCKGKSEGFAPKIKLLNSVINATALYAVEIWGACHIEILEKGKLRFLKSILSMAQNTPNHYVRLETGVEHMSIEIWKRILNWWYKILKMEDSRTPKILYNRLVVLDKSESNITALNWSTQIKIFLTKMGFENVWSNQTINRYKIDDILAVLANTCRDKDLASLKVSTFNNHYKLIKFDANREDYLNLKIPISKTRIICQIRVANKRGLRILHKGVKYELNASEFCSICNTQKPECIFHFFVECPIYHSLRLAYLNEFGVALMNEFELFGFFSNLTINKINKIYHFTLSAFKLRNFCRNE